MKASELGAKDFDVIKRVVGHPYLVIKNREVLGILYRSEGKRFDDFCPLTELEWDDWQLLTPSEPALPPREPSLREKIARRIKKFLSDQGIVHRTSSHQVNVVADELAALLEKEGAE